MKSLATSTDASDLSIKLHVGGIAGDATRIGLSRRVMIGRRAFGMMLRGLVCEGRRRCHKYHDRDRDQRSHFNPHFTRGFSTACLPRYSRTSTATPAGHMRHECGREGGLAPAEPTLEGEARRRATPWSMPAATDQSDRIPSSGALPALCCQPASPAPSRRRSARTAQMNRTASHCKLTPRRS
jgi:hypothetical protein